MVLGLAGGLARRKASGGLVRHRWRAAGATAAAGGRTGLLPVYFRNVDPQGNELTYPLLTHGGIWAAAGVAAGLALGLGAGGQGRWIRCAVGGLLGGVFAAMFYDLIGAVVFPLDKTSQPVSHTAVTRLFAQFSVAVFVAGGAALVAAEPCAALAVATLIFGAMAHCGESAVWPVSRAWRVRKIDRRAPRNPSSENWAPGRPATLFCSSGSTSSAYSSSPPSPDRM